MSQKKLFFVALLALGLVISCSKDDGPSTPPNTAPVIKAQTFSAAENITDATIIGTVTATDADKSDKLTFSIATNSSDLFEITNAGALSLAPGKTLDFDTKKQHVLSIGVSDGKATAKADVTIKVTDVAQNQPPVIEAQGFEAAEDIADTDVIGTVVASDPEQDALTFSISTNDDDIFEIDASSGELSLAEGKALDFETAEGHTITVAVTDGVNDPVSAEITITVTAVYESLADDPASFVTTWVTTVNNETIKIGMNPDYDEYDYTIDWGDGTVEDITNADFINYTVQHEYAEAGTYTVAIKGTFPAIFMDVNAGIVTQADALKLASIEQWGSNPWANMYGAFAGCGNMVYNATDVPDLSQVTHMGSMFSGAEAFNGDLSGWDVSNVTDMSSMFNDAVAFEGIGLSGWDVSSVTDMSYMFAYTNAFNGDLSGWDVSNVTNMSYMFSDADAFNGNISSWDVSSVTDMSYMFRNAGAFNGDLSGWDVSNVTDMRSMFKGATAFNGDLSGWDVSNVTNMNSMFNGAAAFNGDLSDWNVSNVTEMDGMFSGADVFNGDLSSWDVSNVIVMSEMFWGADVFNGDISGWNTGSVVVMFGMFYQAYAFNRDLGAWDISSIDHTTGGMGYMLSYSGLSTANYSSTLEGWANPNAPTNITLDAEAILYCDNLSTAAALNYLTNDKGWTINDGGFVNCN